MKYAEIKQKMTQGEWKHHFDGGEGVCLFPDTEDKRESMKFIGIINGRTLSIVEANAHAIVTAVNNTYVKGIDPEAVEKLIEACKEALRVPPGRVRTYNLKTSVLNKLEQALAKAKGK